MKILISGVRILLAGTNILIDTDSVPVVLMLDEKEKSQIAGMDGRYFASAPDSTSEEELRAVLEHAKKADQ